MRRRTFIQSLLAFTGALALDWKFEFSRVFPFVRRRVQVPRLVATTAAHGPSTLTLPIPTTQKGDVLIAMVQSYTTGKPLEWTDVPGWSLHSSSELNGFQQVAWYRTADRDLGGESASFATQGEKAVAQIHAIRGVKMEARQVTLRAGDYYPGVERQSPIWEEYATLREHRQ